MRPRTHEVGDLGVNAVERLFLAQGWVVNRIQSDYGEDLSVQPVANERVEKYRVYIQVKTIESEARRNVSLRREDLFLWQFSSEPFLLVCWEIGAHRAKFKWLNEYKAPEKYFDLNAKSVSFKLRGMEDLTPIAISRFKAISRELYYQDVLEELSHFIASMSGYAENRHSPEVMAAKLAAVNVACPILQEYGILERRRGGWHVSSNFLDKEFFKETVRHGIELRERHTPRMTYDSLFWAIAVVDYARQKHAGAPVPESILWALSNAVEVVVTSRPPFKWLVRRLVREIRRDNPREPRRGG